MTRPIYLDYAAATPIDPRVLQVMQPFFSDQFYNPSSPYLAAKGVKRDVEDARARVAHWLGVRPVEVVFTAGATESIGIALHGVVRQFKDAHIVYGAIEHDAVRRTAQEYDHTEVPVLPTGLIDLKDLKNAINDRTALVSIGYANNEIGVVQPIKDIANVIAQIKLQRQKDGNNLPLYLHTDASQVPAYLDIHMSRLGVDLITLNGGKIYGPKQTGALGIKTGVKLLSFMTGGGQESGLRSGTENVAGVVGFAAALDIAQQNRKNLAVEHAAMRDELQRRLTDVLSQTLINGCQRKRLPNSLHVSWPGVDGERLVMLLDEHGVMVSTGSACAANKQTESHVLVAIGLDEAARHGSLRLSIGLHTTQQQIKDASDIIIKDVIHLLENKL
ncbi:MAG: cysteine desulfurase family protein [Candidatus Woesebacteria bacterium]|jgi:cysteine desulfurase